MGLFDRFKRTSKESLLGYLQNSISDNSSLEHIVSMFEEMCNMPLKEDMIPELSIESVNVFNVLKLCDEKKYDELTEYLMRAINNLVKSGAEFAALSANTPHIVFDRLKEQSPIPLISIVETTCEEAKHRELKKIGLLGTIFTMTEEFFKAPFVKNGIQVVIPSESELKMINKKISTELELGIIKEETLLFFQNVINRMKNENGIEAIVLGCTELPLLLNDEVSSVPCLDTMQIHISSIIKTILDCSI